MPQHFLRPRRSGTSTSVATPTRTTLKASPQSAPRSVPTTTNEDEDIDQSPSFTGLYVRSSVVDDNGRPVPLSFDCSISRGFFKVKEDWICYRRNYINVSATLVPPIQDSVYVCLPDSQLRVIQHFAFVVAAVTATDPPRPIEMIQHTPKRDKGPQRNPEFVQIAPPTYKAEWSRLQYKVATANNGKKRGQQYFSLKVTILGWIDSAGRPGSWVELGDKYSEPMIVRGRSPGHYNDTDSSYSECDASPPTSPLLDPGTASETTGHSSRRPHHRSASMFDFHYSKDHHRWSHTTPPTAKSQVQQSTRSPPQSQPPPPPPSIDDTTPRVVRLASPVKSGTDSSGSGDRLCSHERNNASEVDRPGAGGGVVGPNESWDPDLDVRLAPIKSFYGCTYARPRLPTYDEVILNECDGDAVVEVLEPPTSPDLQAALSLASISSGSRITTRKRSAVDAMTSPRPNKPMKLEPHQD